MTLEELDVPPVGGGRHCDHKVINVGENQASGDGGVEGGDVNNKQKGGDRGALRSTHGDGREHSWRTLEKEPALAVGEEAADPGYDVPMYPFGPQCSGELCRVDIVKATLDVEEEGGDLEVKALEETDLVSEGCCGVERGEAGEGTGLVRVEKATGPGEQLEA